MAPISRLLAGLAFALVSLAAGSRRRAVFKPLTPYVQTLHARRPSVIGGLLPYETRCCSSMVVGGEEQKGASHSTGFVINQSISADDRESPVPSNHLDPNSVIRAPRPNIELVMRKDASETPPTFAGSST
ncbi:hypothetical protein DFH09DRAFT_1118885 [Mycena vulgaris]|nr:hypothetical protein DFH09DRAFT_1118885 [Mycena vulgaris]